jgi:phosphoglycolate phosphatase-like HAD superfamily hydrolase
VPGRARTCDQERILREALDRAAAAAPDGVTVFDLDSTLLDNRPRQARIVREYGRAAGLPALTRVTAAGCKGWDLSVALRGAGLSPREVEAHAPALFRFWAARFFTSEHCREDVPVPGAPAFARAIAAAGGRIAYVTGRPERMRAGTVDTLERHGFPVPDGGRVTLLMKPDAAQPDDAFKVEACARVAALGPVVAAFDNEPAHVNLYAEAWPGARCVHLDTDHSPRPIAVLARVPSVRDLRLEPREAPAPGAQRRASRTSSGTSGASPPPPRMFTTGDDAARTTEPPGLDGPSPQ